MTTGDRIRQITRWLNSFFGETKALGNLNMHDRSIDAERIFGRVLSLVLNCTLVDLNQERKNHPAVDLGDKTAGIAVQITTDKTPAKVQHTLNGFFKYELDKVYPTRLLVMVIAVETVYPKDFYCTRSYSFDKERDIWDIPRLIYEISRSEDNTIRAVYDYLIGQFGEAVRPTHQLPGVPCASPSFVPGSRDRELAELRELLASKQPVFLWGLGGIGKTEVAIQLANQFAPAKGAYFLHYSTLSGEEEAMRETILHAHINGYRFEGPDDERREREYQQRMDILRREYAGAMLIIDNFDRDGKSLKDLLNEDTFCRLRSMDIQLVITTRSVVEDGYEIKPISEVNLLKLMRSQYSDNSVSDDTLLELIRAVDCHTLMVDLIAKTMEESWGEISASYILDGIKKGIWDSKQLPGVSVIYDQKYTQNRIDQYLWALFDATSMSSCAKEVLQCAALLPEDGMDALLFQNCWSLNKQNNLEVQKALRDARGQNAAETFREYYKEMRNLVSYGWLRRQNKTLTIHPVIRQVVLAQLTPNDETCMHFLSGMWNQYDLKQEYNGEHFRQMANCFSVATETLEDCRGDWALLAGRLWKLAGFAQVALKYELKSIARREQLFNDGEANNAYSNYSEAILELAIAYGNIGVTYTSLGDYKKALEYQEKALIERRKVIPEGDLQMAISYGNLGNIYSAMGEYSQALEYRHHALQIRETILDERDLNLARSYNNIGCNYSELGEYEKALEYVNKALAIWKCVGDKQHPHLATLYNNLSYIYGAMGMADEELRYDRRALRIRKTVLHADHPSLATSYYNVGITYLKAKDYTSALEYMAQALSIWEKRLPENHKRIVSAKKSISWIRKKMTQQEIALP